MSLVKGKEVLNKKEEKTQIGYLSINLSPEQWKLVKQKKIKVDEIVNNNDKIFVDKDGNNRLDMRLSLNNKSTNIKVLGDENIKEIIELFEEIETVYCRVTYEQIYMKGRRLIDLEILEYDTDKNDNEEEELFS